MSGVWMAGATVAGAALSSEAQKDAASASLAGTDRALNIQTAQADQTRTDLLPFLQAATGATEVENPEYKAIQDRITQVERTGQKSDGLGIVALRKRLNALTPTISQAGETGGALEQFTQGIEQAPQLDEVQQFQFDPTAALDSPALQFQREMGQQQMDRLAGTNRQLGSGQRLIGAQQFGQGLASQSLGDEYNRQFQTSQAQNNALLQNNALRNDAFNQRMNRLAGLVDVGRGTGGTLAQSGAQSAGNISNLLQSQGQTEAAGILGQNALVSNLIGQGIGAAGFASGGGTGTGGQAPASFNPTAPVGLSVNTDNG